MIVANTDKLDEFKMKKKRLDSTITMGLILANITMPVLFKKLIETYANPYAKSVDWINFLSIRDSAKLSCAMSEVMQGLRNSDPVAHAVVCGILTIVGVAATTKSIRQFMRTQTERNEITKKYFNQDLFNSTPMNGGSLTEPYNRALWFSVRGEIRSQWEALVQMATTEQQKHTSWTTFEIDTPTVCKHDEITEGLKAFEQELEKYFKGIKPIKFRVEALPSLTTEKFQRYVISTNKDPQITRVVKDDNFENGIDANANTFLIDHYYNADILRVMDPDVVSEQIVAKYFCEQVLKCQSKASQSKYYNLAMRPFADRSSCERKLALTKEEQKDIKSIQLESIVFTCSKNAEEAELRRYATVEEKSKGKSLPKLPRFACLGYLGPSIFDVIERHFGPDDPSCPIEGRDVVSLRFAVELYVHGSQTFLTEEDRLASEKANRYHIVVSGKKADTEPQKWKIANSQHASLLRRIKDEKLGFIGISFEELRNQYISEHNHVAK